MKQYISGYIIDNFLDLFEPGSKIYDDVNSLLRRLTHFQVISKSKMENDHPEYPSNIAVLINILQRGLPTKLNMFALRYLVENSSLLEFDQSNSDEIKIRFTSESDETRKLFFRALHPIDSRLTVEDLSANYQKTWENLDDKYEIEFLQKELPDALEKILKDPSNYFIQLLTRQRSLSNIIERSEKNEISIGLDEDKSIQQPTDYSLEMPYSAEGKPQGIVIEVDGELHSEDEQSEFDKKVNEALQECNWYETLRLTKEDFKTTDYFYKLKNSLFDIVYSDYISTCRDNFFNPLWADAVGNEILHLSLIPFAIARIQRTLLEAIAQEKLPLQKDSWKIAIIERDVPCGKLAFDDLQETVFRLSSLLDEKDKLFFPEIHLKIYITEEFQNSRFQSADTELISNFKDENTFDLIIDVSTLEANQHPNQKFQNAEEVITIRSSQYIEEDRKICTNSLLKYNAFSITDNDEISNDWETDSIATKNLEYFLQSIFRKQTFRDHQIPILNSSLQCESVIGLLAPGSGKSITYQLSAFLQPGVCMIVNPTKSLIKNQVDSLQNNKIDICSSLCTFFDNVDRKELFQKLVQGNIQFLHISPDQLRTREFREILRDMHNAEQYFSYCVIDEAHCISEWGHDFRTNYLKLVKFAGNNCKTKNLDRLPFFSLTATASYDVVMDICNEFENYNEDNIIKSKNLVGEESQYVIENCEINDEVFNDTQNFSDILGAQKQDTLISLLEEIPKKFEEISKTPAGIIFCPHESGYYGVTDRFNQQTYGVFRGSYDNVYLMDHIKAGFYVSSDKSNRDINEKSLSHQDDFQKNKTNLMVATKDFGIGIDERNIRYTIHLNYPMSIENFVQESGRAVRDGNPTYSYILFNDQSIEIDKRSEKFDHDLEINKTSLMHSRSSFEKEMIILDEMLSEIVFPGRIGELSDKIYKELGISNECHYVVENDIPKLIINKHPREIFGFIDLNSMEEDISESFEEENSTAIFDLVKQFFLSQELAPEEWIKYKDSTDGMLKVLERTNEGDSFEIEFGFSNNISILMKDITEWLRSIVNEKIDQKKVLQWSQSSRELSIFLGKLNTFLRDENDEENPTNFLELCKKQDQKSNVESGTNYKDFCTLYNQCRHKEDSELAIYRLLLLGVIDGYYINENTSKFIIYGKKKNISDYQQNLMEYLSRFFSKKLINTKLQSYAPADEPDTIRKYLYTLVSFSNREILDKQQNAIQIMQDACSRAIGKDHFWLKEYLNKFVKYKYLISGYNFRKNDGQRVTSSLLDDTNNGEYQNIQLVWHYIDIVNSDPSGSQVENLKHLRNSCDALIKINPENFTVLLLKAYTIYMLKFTEKSYLDEAEKLLVKAFTTFQENTENIDETVLEDNYNKFIIQITNHNEEIRKLMEEYGLEFGFSSIMISHFLKPLQFANKTLNSLNKILSSISI